MLSVSTHPQKWSKTLERYDRNAYNPQKKAEAKVNKPLPSVIKSATNLKQDPAIIKEGPNGDPAV